MAWLTVYPAAGLRGQHLPVMPMVRTLTDALHRVGRLRFTELRVHAPVALARDAGFDLRAATATSRRYRSRDSSRLATRPPP